MKYMKKLVIFLIAFLGLISCAKTEYMSPQEIKEIQYEQAFEKAFGKIDKNQTWGFAQSSMTRSAQPNSNQWGTNDWDGRYKDYPKPADITVEERAKVLAVFNQKGKESYTDLVNWTNFFMQQVYCGPNGTKMNQLACWDNDGHNQVIYGDPNHNYQPYTVFSHDDEVNNFNGGKYSGNAEQGCMLMFNSSTSQWSFKTSQSAGERIYDHWRMEEIDGNYYVGLDHEAWRQAPANANEEDFRDYIYNDWIIKIVPGKGQTPPDKVKEEGMIICEDLGTVGDFDFNDVVFYAKVWESGKTEITLLAAGGTLDISIAGVDVGEVMGKMVNTGLKDVPTYYFVAENTYNALIDIPIVVSSTDAAGNVTSYELSAEMGKAPQKICVPLGFRWCKEYKSLVRAYPGFRDWTTGAADTWCGEYDESLLYN